eukprot:2190278-Lingulodinium_polyedra.AAC.1
MPNETEVEDILGDTAHNLGINQQQDSASKMHECKRRIAVQIATIKRQNGTTSGDRSGRPGRPFQYRPQPQ